MSRYIDADNLIELANNTKDKTIDANDIARFPTADVRENVKGEWIYNHDETGFYKCSVCGCAVLACTKYCPDCGADMRGGNS